MRVQLGNPAAKDAGSGEPLDGNRVTTVVIPDTYTPIEAFATVTAQDGVWNSHTRGDGPQGVTPDWVECDDKTLELMLTEHYGCRVGRPRGWKEAGA